MQYAASYGTIGTSTLRRHVSRCSVRLRSSSHSLLGQLGIPILASLLLAVSARAATPGFGGFLENIGQFDDPVRFSTSISGMNVFLTKGGLVIDMFDPVVREVTESSPPDLSRRFSASERMGPSRRDGHVVRIRFQGANTTSTMTAGAVLPGVFNFFRGADPSSWHTGARRFSEVVYHEIWPGIDLVFRVGPTGLEYEALVGPGADPSQVRFVYEGADHVQESGGGDRIQTSVGDLVNRLPVAGETSGSIRRDGAGEGSPRSGDCGAFFDWLTLLGGSGEDWGGTIELDASGRPVVSGQIISTDFPTTSGAYADSSAGDWDTFITKFNDTGSDLVWSTYIGGDLLDWGLALALDPFDNVVISGMTASADYPTTPGAYDTIPSAPVGDFDAFVTKLPAEGDSLIWSTYLGGDQDQDEDTAGMVLDAEGNVLVCGQTFSGDFPTTDGAYRTTHPDGDRDAFVTKLATEGDHLIWSTLLGSDDAGTGEFTREITLDAAENPLVCGLTGSPNFPTTPGAFDRTYNGSNDGFITKLAADGSALVWSTFVGGTRADRVEDLEIDPVSGDVLAGARTYSFDFPTTPDAFDTTFNTTIDGAVLRMSEDGRMLLWSTFLGGTGDDWLGGIAIGPGCLVAAGRTSAVDFPTTEDAFDPTYNGGAEDGFITIVRNDGAALLWSTYVGGSTDDLVEGFSDDYGSPVVVNGNEAYITGLTGSDDFPTCPSGGVWDETFNGVLDVVVLKMPLSPLTTNVEPDFSAMPAMLQIQSLAPNPFHPSTEISFRVSESGPVTLGVYDLAGRRVAENPLGILAAGPHRTQWDGRREDGSPVPAGLYFLRLQGSTARSQPVRAVLVR